jgi:hypothetical protein
MSAFIALPSLARASCKAIEKPRLGMNGNGCAGSTASGVSSGKDMRKKIIFEPGLLRLADVGTVDQGDAGFAQRRAQFAPLRLLILNKNNHGFGNAHELLGRSQPLGTFRADAGAHLGPKAGDAHHEEFVEVVGRNRQKSQPLEQRMFAIGGFLENAAIEIKPRQFPVDEAFRT